MGKKADIRFLLYQIKMKAKALEREGEVIRDQIKENKQTIHE